MGIGQEVKGKWCYSCCHINKDITQDKYFIKKTYHVYFKTPIPSIKKLTNKEIRSLCLGNNLLTYIKRTIINKNKLLIIVLKLQTYQKDKNKYGKERAIST